MANPRSFSTATAAAPLNQKPPAPGRHRLRAVDRDETVPAAFPAAVTAGQAVDFLPPGATWLPAPQHTLPSLPGQPPMVGYLVLVPADQHAAALAASVPYLAADAGDRAARGAAPGTETAGGPVRIDSVQRTALVDGQQLDLTYLEFELLAHLVAHPHRVHTRDQLVTTVWGYGHVGDGRTVDVHVARLRRKLGVEHRHTIQTVRRVGYKYAP
ncbi:winged helix-turn-helix domain-containing protein [Streptomyces sp. SID3212]|uniref:winged helix-turn-helix domain-containing protein n=1 Tax=unclassified Streptomyces TaxID=2593676 RepID=UPI00136A438A|nr:winged helix-turn-helix domain-containing protein [Streptomyces sp. SID3212]MYV52267.1 winged helix family transcriptional regulator [Streptomyces sp. SID3212]